MQQTYEQFKQQIVQQQLGMVLSSVPFTDDKKIAEVTKNFMARLAKASWETAIAFSIRCALNSQTQQMPLIHMTESVLRENWVIGLFVNTAEDGHPVLEGVKFAE